MLKGALIGLVVMVLAALIPVLHFITGPHLLGGFIGGFVGGSRVKATPRTALGVGSLMGGLVLALGAPLLVLLTLVFPAISSEDRGFFWALAVGGALWIGAQGALGALVGGHTARRKASARSTPSPLHRSSPL